ncbi:MAG: LLM class F420-dependent oxidoreductase, partial [Acidimicrobiia bacterium]
MRCSFKTSPQNTTWQAMRDVWRAADQIEVFDAGWTFDHFYPIFSDSTGPCLEGWTVLAALATETSRLRLGVMVSGNTYRHPAVLANMAATLDVVSEGRLEIGLGAGWNEEEHAAYGIELPPLRERFDRFDEALEVVHLLLTEEVATFEGRHYRLTEARCEPKPIQRPHPPIVVGGRGERRTLRAAARWADHWNYPGGDPDDLRHRIQVLHA